MLGQTHVINVGFLCAGIRQHNRVIPEMEAVDTSITLCNSKERFSVIALHADNEMILSIQINRAGVHHSVDAETLHKVRIRLLIQIISPVNRSELSCQHRILIAVINTVVKICFCVLSCHKAVYLGFFHIILFIQHLLTSQLLPYTSVHCDTGISTVLQSAHGSGFRLHSRTRTTQTPLVCRSHIP